MGAMYSTTGSVAVLRSYSANHIASHCCIRFAIVLQSFAIPDPSICQAFAPLVAHIRCQRPQSRGGRQTTALTFRTKEGPPQNETMRPKRAVVLPISPSAKTGLWRAHCLGYMGLAATACVATGARVPGLSPIDDPDASQTKHEVLKKKSTFRECSGANEQPINRKFGCHVMFQFYVSMMMSFQIATMDVLPLGRHTTSKEAVRPVGYGQELAVPACLDCLPRGPVMWEGGGVGPWLRGWVPMGGH